MVGPERGLKQRKDPLWLDMAAVHTRPANRPDIPADAVDAIPIFKDKPVSDEEQEQCSRQLTAQVLTMTCILGSKTHSLNLPIADSRCLEQPATSIAGPVQGCNQATCICGALQNIPDPSTSAMHSLKHRSC